MRLVDGDALLEKWRNLSERGRIEFDQVIMCEPTVDAIVVTDRKKHISSFDFDDNRPQCCIDHDKYFSTCDTCEFGEQYIGGENIMGMYTEINVCFDLLRNTPKDIVDILHCLVEGTDTPSILPEHKFFKCDRWDMVACCDSYYFDGSTNSKMVFDDISKTWKINIRANLKNYDSEIEEFLDWLEPYIGTEGFIGYMRYEEWEDPTLIYNDFDNDKIVFKGVEATEVEQI